MKILNHNIIKAFKNDPIFAKYLYFNGGINILYQKITNKKLRPLSYAGGKVIPSEIANKLLLEKIKTNTPLLIGRFGSGELDCMRHAAMVKKNISKEINLEVCSLLSNNNGLFPIEKDTYLKFETLMSESISKFDMIGVWYNLLEDYYIKNYGNNNLVLTHRNVFDFWQFEIPFTYALKGKKVLVIHPFDKTIAQQYKKREKLFKNPNILPEFELITLKAVQTIAGQRDERFDTWFDALEYMFNEAIKIDFDVAIIGCGAYGFPLAAKLRDFGKIAIHMGGVTQMLFGIIGKRWEEDIKSGATILPNEYWVRPDTSEVPKEAQSIENGCYW